MSVIVQRHGDIGMSHDVLQVFGVHPSVGEAGLEIMCVGTGGLFWRGCALVFGLVFLSVSLLC